MKPLVNCACCAGEGKTPMPDQYFEALRLVRKRPGIQARTLAQLCQVNGTTMCNRMAWLRSRGFVESSGSGTRYSPMCWSPAQQKGLDHGQG